MPKLKQSPPALDPIEQDFRDALSRLQKGEPKNRELKKDLDHGVLKINFSSVAMEAGRSRTLIALEKCCRYPATRELIKQAKAGGKGLPATYSELVKKLRADKTELISQVKKYQVEALIHFHARVKAEKVAASAKASESRALKALSKVSTAVKIVPSSDAESA